MKKYRTFLYIIILFFVASTAAKPIETAAKSEIIKHTERRDFAATWAYMFYYGQMTTGTSINVYRFKYQLDPHRASIYSLEAAYTVGRNNILRKILQPLLSDVELVANAAYQNDPLGNIFEINPFMMFRWRNFFWDPVLLTTLGIGEGLSWASSISRRELSVAQDPTYPRRLMNLLIFEVTAGLPQYPNWQILYRIHHRSGVFGVFCKGIISSNLVGVGIRYLA